MAKLKSQNQMEKIHRHFRNQLADQSRDLNYSGNYFYDNKVIPVSEKNVALINRFPRENLDLNQFSNFPPDHLRKLSYQIHMPMSQSQIPTQYNYDVLPSGKKGTNPQLHKMSGDTKKPNNSGCLKTSSNPVKLDENRFVYQETEKLGQKNVIQSREESESALENELRHHENGNNFESHPPNSSKNHIKTVQSNDFPQNDPKIASNNNHIPPSQIDHPIGCHYPQLNQVYYPNQVPVYPDRYYPQFQGPVSSSLPVKYLLPPKILSRMKHLVDLQNLEREITEQEWETIIAKRTRDHDAKSETSRSLNTLLKNLNNFQKEQRSTHHDSHEQFGYNPSPMRHQRKNSPYRNRRQHFQKKNRNRYRSEPVPESDRSDSNNIEFSPPPPSQSSFRKSNIFGDQDMLSFCDSIQKQVLKLFSKYNEDMLSLSNDNFLLQSQINKIQIFQSSNILDSDSLTPPILNQPKNPELCLLFPKYGAYILSQFQNLSSNRLNTLKGISTQISNNQRLYSSNFHVFSQLSKLIAFVLKIWLKIEKTGYFNPKSPYSSKYVSNDSISNLHPPFYSPTKTENESYPFNVQQISQLKQLDIQNSRLVAQYSESKLLFKKVTSHQNLLKGALKKLDNNKKKQNLKPSPSPPKSANDAAQKEIHSLKQRIAKLQSELQDSTQSSAQIKKSHTAASNFKDLVLNYSKRYFAAILADTQMAHLFYQSIILNEFSMALDSGSPPRSRPSSSMSRLSRFSHQSSRFLTQLVSENDSPPSSRPQTSSNSPTQTLPPGSSSFDLDPKSASILQIYRTFIPTFFDIGPGPTETIISLHLESLSFQLELVPSLRNTLGVLPMASFLSISFMDHPIQVSTVLEDFNPKVDHWAHFLYELDYFNLDIISSLGLDISLHSVLGTSHTEIASGRIHLDYLPKLGTAIPFTNQVINLYLISNGEETTLEVDPTGGSQGKTKLQGESSSESQKLALGSLSFSVTLFKSFSKQWEVFSNMIKNPSLSGSNVESIVNDWSQFYSSSSIKDQKGSPDQYQSRPDDARLFSSASNRPRSSLGSSLNGKTHVSPRSPKRRFPKLQSSSSTSSLQSYSSWSNL